MPLQSKATRAALSRRKLLTNEAELAAWVGEAERRELLQEARVLFGVQKETVLVREGRKVLTEGESARRFARREGPEPQLESIPRRRSRTAS